MSTIRVQRKARIGVSPRLLGGLLLASVTTGVTLGRAEDPNRAVAQALYDEGIKLMDAGQVAEGCKKLETSDKLYQGIGVKGRLGECFEKQGLLASAWSSYRSALSLAESKNDPRASELRNRAQSLESRLSHVTIDVSAAKVPRLVVKRDGLELPEPLWGAKIPVDGGSHSIEVSAPDKKTFSTTVTVKLEKDEVTVVVPKLESLSGSPTPVASAVSSTQPPAPALSSSSNALAPTVPSAAPPKTSGEMGPLRTVGLITGIVGAVGLGVAGGFAVTAASKNSDSKADNRCNAANICNSTGTSLRNDAKSSANLATVFVIGGGALLAGGATMFLLGGSRQPSQGYLLMAPSVAQAGGGVSVAGAW